MADIPKNHLYLESKFFSEKASYDYPRPPPQKQIVPARERGAHAVALREQLTGIRQDIAAAIKLQEDSKSILDKGIIVEFESFEGIGEALEEKQFGGNSELLNIRYEDKRTFATVFIPDGSLEKFEDKITAYSAHKQRSDGVPADNQPLIDSIASFHKATVKALWTDTVAMPQDNTITCWEVWLSVRGDRRQQVEGFKSLAKTLEIDVSDAFIVFKERIVLLIRATKEQLEKSIILLNNIAELRKAKTTADFFSELKGEDQKDWQEDLVKRITVLPINENTPFVCILDTGINGAHPLLRDSIIDSDLYTINEAWGKDDRVGHGTGIAGLSLFGDLTTKLENTDLVEITHRLESSKIINRSEFIPDEKDWPLDLYAEYTEQAIYQAEIPHAARRRVFQLAITTIDSWDRGKPSSWSAALDKLAFGDNSYKRLFIVSAGNADVMLKNVKYPEFNMSESIRDPGQAWNVLTVGAFTEKDVLSIAEGIDHNLPTAFHGQISPYTTTSFSWENEWPLKPDVVMEGGNTAKNEFGQAQADSLSLLSTNSKFTEKPFIPMWATSASSALVSKLCADIMQKYPALKPETIRALIIQSASWTSEMRKQFDCDKPKNKKEDYKRLVRICGFGVPDLGRALASMNNDFTMIVEDSIQPYIAEKTSKLNEVKFYTLPFPKSELEVLGPTSVEMKVTLSYFIEPNPSSRGRSHHSYRSHGLRFDIKTPAEDANHFKGRITKAMQEEGQQYKIEESDKWWAIGVQGRTKGSVHTDIWNGSAAELAGCNVLAVYPVSGWWKSQKDKKVVNGIANFSLLISIKTSADIDLMTPAEILIQNKVKTSISNQI